MNYEVEWKEKEKSNTTLLIILGSVFGGLILIGLVIFISVKCRKRSSPEEYTVRPGTEVPDASKHLLDESKGSKINLSNE